MSYAAALGSMVRGIVVLSLVTTTFTAPTSSVFGLFPPKIPLFDFGLGILDFGGFNNFGLGILDFGEFNVRVLKDE